MDRRTYVTTVGVVGLGPAMAGCLGDDDDETDDGDPDDGPADVQNGDADDDQNGDADDHQNGTGDDDADDDAGDDADDDSGDDRDGDSDDDDDEDRAEFAFVDLSHDNVRIDADEIVDVEVVVEHTGDSQQTGTLTFAVDGDVVDESDVSIAAGESTTVTGTIDASDHSHGELRYSFTTASAETTGTIVIRPSEFGDVLSVGSIDDLGALPFDANVVAEFSGTGEAVTDTFTLEEGMVVYACEYDGERALGVDLEQTDGDDSHMFAALLSADPEEDDVGQIAGADIGIADGGTYELDVTELDDADWRIHVAQPRTSPDEGRTPPVRINDTHDTVVGPVAVDDGAYVAFAHSHPEFADEVSVWSYEESAASPSEYGATFGTEDPGFAGFAFVDLDGTVWFDIDARGEWSLEVA